VLWCWHGCRHGAHHGYACVLCRSSHGRCSRVVPAEMMAGQLELLRLATGTSSRVVSAMTMLKRRLYQCVLLGCLPWSHPAVSWYCDFYRVALQVPRPHFCSACVGWRGCHRRAFVHNLPSRKVPLCLCFLVGLCGDGVFSRPARTSSRL
jgi:hypothetical protein